MIAALLVLAQAVAQPPNPSANQAVVTADDYPRRAMDRGEEGTVAFDALIAPDGRVDKCTVIVSSGSDDLDQATCRLVMTRARFAPAENASGKPAYGIFRSVITWSLGHVASGHLDPELELTINQAPPGSKLPVVMTMSFWTRTDGSNVDCKLDKKSADAPQVLADLACSSILAQPPEVVRNSAGQPVEVSNTMTVGFRLGH